MNKFTFSVPNSELDSFLEWLAGSIDFQFAEWLPSYRCCETGESCEMELQSGELWGVTLWRFQLQNGHHGSAHATKEAALLDAESAKDRLEGSVQESIHGRPVAWR